MQWAGMRKAGGRNRFVEGQERSQGHRDESAIKKKYPRENPSRPKPNFQGQMANGRANRVAQGDGTLKTQNGSV